MLQKFNKEQFYFLASALISGFINFIKPKKPLLFLTSNFTGEIADKNTFESMLVTIFE